MFRVKIRERKSVLLSCALGNYCLLRSTEPTDGDKQDAKAKHSRFESRVVGQSAQLIADPRPVHSQDRSPKSTLTDSH